jgi:transcriptional regulator with GAF, ATPase, and Fis domain
VIAGSAAQAFLDKVGGSLIGHSLILLGLLQWVPLISRVRKGELELKRYSEKLGTLVEDRTAELTFSNNRLLKVVEDRNHAVAFAEDMNRWLIESESQLDKTFQELAGLYEISRIFSTMGDLATKATAALEKVAVMSRADWVTLRMPKGDETGLHLVASAGPAVAESAPVAVFTGAMTMSSAAFTEGRRIVIDDYPAAPHANQVLVDLGMRSMVILPVKARDRTVGLVTVVSQKNRHFTKELVDLVTVVVKGLGGLIENSMLHEES